VAKPTLGRGLGDLLGKNRTSAEPSAPLKPPGVGLRTLIDGAQEEKKADEAAKPSQVNELTAQAVAHESRTRWIAILALAGADLALLCWTAQYVLSHLRTMGFGGAVECIGSIMLAALCGCAAASIAVKGTNRRKNLES
jgi:hypothetical protein